KQKDLKLEVTKIPYEAIALLMTSIQENDLIIFMEHMKLYRSFRGEVTEEDYTIELGKAAVKREGTDVTLISYGAMVHTSLKAAEELEEQGVSAEVIDLRTISPIDVETIIESVTKTNR